MHSLCVLVNIFVQILYITIFKKVIQETDRNVKKRASLTLTQRILFSWFGFGTIFIFKNVRVSENCSTFSQN